MAFRTSLAAGMVVVGLGFVAGVDSLIAADAIQVNVEGVVTEVGTEGLILRTEQGIDYTVSVSPERVFEKVMYKGLPEPIVSVTGRGLPGNVVRGAIVSLDLDLTARREARNEISSVRIMTGSDETVLGCWSKNGGEVRAEPTPFEQVGEGKWRVVGQIAEMRGNRVAIAVRNGVGIGIIRGTFAEEPLIELDVTDHRYAMRGDRAVLRGVSPKLPFVFATELRVKRKEAPLAIPPKPEPLAEVDPAKPPAEPEPEDGEPDSEQPRPNSKPLTILKVN